MFDMGKTLDQLGRALAQYSPIPRFLFQNTLAEWSWFVVRMWVGLQLLQAGWHTSNDPAWMDGSGNGILRFWTGALPNSVSSASIITNDRYHDFLQLLVESHPEGWFSKVIIGGEIAVGFGCILSAVTGLAGTRGFLLNITFLLAGATSTRPVLAVLVIVLIVAWKNAGYPGLNRYLLPLLGLPWQQLNLSKQARSNAQVPLAPL